MPHHAPLAKSLKPQPPEPRWCLVITTADSHSWSTPVRILALTEDCVPIAKERGWVVLARDSDFTDTA